jgi:hypothetical protein
MVVGDAIADGVFGSTLMSADGAGTAWPPLLCANVTLLEKQQRQRASESPGPRQTSPVACAPFNLHC